MKRIRVFLSVCFCLISGSIVVEAAAQEKQPVAIIIAALNARVEAQCSIARMRQSLASTAYEKAQVNAAVKMNCECLPPEIERAGNDLSGGNPDATITEKVYETRLKAAINLCVAKGVREDIQTRCENEDITALGITDKKAYCGCVVRQVKGLSDEAIASASTVTKMHFEEKVRARMEGKPDPVSPLTAIDEVTNFCKQEEK
ncbi:hypothetical protein Geob_0182 [Geotalea daltonii FRC-32]|uniref:Uncharacterized protein n=1 Tax=Geotalea daltonii (strain DSM 22248 / JCM 15807 / FRC-32) TaxID=316067 RepID=B9M8M0_GEODF|nr:hypothetical protein [Geotalea daltonii]ACM18555.1 hypothetical protein Geob_0182 [Geotalea daltonii FRC-32]